MILRAFHTQGALPEGQEGQTSRPNPLECARVHPAKKLETQHHPEGGHAEERAAGPGNPTLSPAKGNCGPAGSGRLKGALLLTSSGCVWGGPICSLEHPHRTEERRAALETGTWLPGARGARGIR